MPAKLSGAKVAALYLALSPDGQSEFVHELQYHKLTAKQRKNLLTRMLRQLSNEAITLNKERGKLAAENRTLLCQLVQDSWDRKRPREQLRERNKWIAACARKTGSENMSDELIAMHPKTTELNGGTPMTPQAVQAARRRMDIKKG